MLTARRTTRARGFTLVELLVAVTVMAIGISLAAPGLNRLVVKYRVRALADGMLQGILYARAEAIRRNASVTFALGADRSGWTVAQVSPSTTLQAWPAGEGGGVSITPDTTGASVTFLPTGLLQPGTQMRRITVGPDDFTGGERRIDIFGGGLVRMCDPAVTASDDPRRC